MENNIIFFFTDKAGTACDGCSVIVEQLQMMIGKEDGFKLCFKCAKEVMIAYQMIEGKLGGIYD